MRRLPPNESPRNILMKIKMFLSFLAAEPNFLTELGVNIISGIIGSIIFAAASFAFGFIKYKRKKNFYNALFYDISLIGHKKEQYFIKHYIKHNFKSAGSQSIADADVSFKSFVKNVKSENVKTLIILGNAGVGKSALMCRLALLFRMSPTNDNGKNNTLTNYGILYKKPNKGTTVNLLAKEIKNSFNVENGRRYSLFIDGLDEIADLKTKSGTEVLNDLLSELGKPEYTGNLGKIFISMRPEILDGGYSALKSLMTREEAAVYKICNFNEKQILTLYRISSHIKTRRAKNRKKFPGNKTKISARKRIQNLKSVIKDNPESIFSYPLILTWADDILSVYGDCEQLRRVSRYEALGIAVNKDFEREYGLYREAQGKIILDTEYSEDRFIEDGKLFLSEIAVKTALSDNQRIYKDDVLNNDVVKRYNFEQGETTGNTFLAHRLLKYVDSSENENGKPYFEFIHNDIFLRVLAKTLLTPETPQKVRADIVIKYKRSRLLTNIVCKDFGMNTGSSWFRYCNYSDYMRAVNGKAVECKSDNGICPEIILSCFYGFEKVTFGNTVKFDFSRIKDFVENRKLNFSGMHVDNLSLLNLFGKSSYDILDCSLTDITSAEIPDYVKEIKFTKCAFLKNVTIRNGLNRIGDSAFWHCDSLESILIPDSVKFINRTAFAECASLKSVSLPKNLTVITIGAFLQCKSLENIVIPDGVTAIEQSAFKGCASLKNVKLSKKLTFVGNSAFFGCASLKSIILPRNLNTIDSCAFSKCSSLENIIIPDGVDYLGAAVFYGCTSLKKIILSKNLASIGESAFYGCTELAEIDIPCGVSIISKCVFLKCSSLKKIDLPSGLIEIKAGAFQRCVSLESITIPESVFHIQKAAFAGCLSLKSLTLPEKLKDLEDGAFFECNSLSDIYYGGTRKQWSCVKKGNDCFPKNGYIIHCSDGDTTESGLPAS